MSTSSCTMSELWGFVMQLFMLLSLNIIFHFMLFSVFNSWIFKKMLRSKVMVSFAVAKAQAFLFFSGYFCYTHLDHRTLAISKQLCVIYMLLVHAHKGTSICQLLCIYIAQGCVHHGLFLNEK